MVKGSFSPFLMSKSSSSPPVVQGQSANPSRMSTSSMFHSLRRIDTIERDSPPSSRPYSMQSATSATPTLNNPARHSTGSSTDPLVNLKFTGPSLLDVVAKESTSKQPLYVIETVKDVTFVYRLNPHLRTAIKAASVQWPQNLSKGKGKSGRMVQIGEGTRWREAEELLKPGPLGNLATRKFNIPHFPHALKWKSVPGNSYYCTTSSIKGPIAVLDAAVITAPPRIRVFPSPLNGDGDADRAQENFNGVPVLLLDYLVITAMLLVTDVQEWLDRPQNESGRVRIPGSSNPLVKKWLAIVHDEIGRPGSPTSTLAPGSSSWDAQSVFSANESLSAGSSDVMSPSTPATSVGSYFSPGRDEIIPPVPPLPPAARLRSQTFSESQGQPHAVPPPPPPPLPIALQAGLLPQTPTTSASSRPLPRPPPGLPAPVPSRPWSSGGRPTTPHVPHSMSPPHRSPSPSTSSGSSISRRSRAIPSISRTLLIANAPPVPPPQQSLPLPPKLQQEYNASQPSLVSQHVPQPPTMSPTPSTLDYPPQGESSSDDYQMSNPDMSYYSGGAQMNQLATSMQSMSVSPPVPSAHSYYPHSHHVMNPAPPPMPMMSPPAHVHPVQAQMHSGNMMPGYGVGMQVGSPRISYAESVYEHPPPAYDAIDFSLPQVQLSHRSSNQPL